MQRRFCRARAVRAWGVLVALLLLTAPLLAAADLFSAWERQAREPRLNAEVQRIARQAVMDTVLHRPLHIPQGWKSPLLFRPAGVFVTLIRRGGVRGCMGSLHGEEAFAALEIARVAALAAAIDVRYPAIRPAELSELEIRVSIAGPHRRVSSLSDLDPLHLGLLVEGGGRGAVLLPGEVLTAGRQLAECKRKAGIPRGCDVLMYVFPTVVI